VIAEHVADVYLKLGERAHAVEFLEKALALDKKGERKQILEEKLKDLEQKKK
jgi:predicted negative regulator of RcsB-dependent stress response